MGRVSGESSPPSCYGWKDSTYETTPRDIYLMYKHCISCNFYHDCCRESEENNKKRANKDFEFSTECVF